jgi:NADPH:quinone reductase-like Zn-dependent oxidoreductase
MVAMKAVRFHDYSGPDGLLYEEVERPLPQPGQMLVRVLAAGVNPVDVKLESGQMRQHLPLRLPHIAGLDFSGKIVEIPGVIPGFSPGEEVYGRTQLGGEDGSYAEYVVVGPEDIARKPKRVDHAHAAAIPTPALAAWQALFGADGKPGMGLARGQTILIHGASGGVGVFAVQFARWVGARVVATASGEDQEFLRRIGADRVIDYRSQRFEDVVQGLDAVLDTIGGETQRRSVAVLRPGGILVSLVGVQFDVEKVARDREVSTLSIFARQDAGILAEVARLVDEGAVVVPVADVLPLSDARAAQKRLEEAHVRGKLVLSVG